MRERRWWWLKSDTVAIGAWIRPRGDVDWTGPNGDPWSPTLLQEAPPSGATRYTYRRGEASVEVIAGQSYLTNEPGFYVPAAADASRASWIFLPRDVAQTVLELSPVPKSAPVPTPIEEMEDVGPGVIVLRWTGPRPHQSDPLLVQWRGPENQVSGLVFASDASLHVASVPHRSQSRFFPCWTRLFETP